MIAVRGCDRPISVSPNRNRRVVINRKRHGRSYAAEFAMARPGGDELPFVYSGTLVVQDRESFAKAIGARKQKCGQMARLCRNSARNDAFATGNEPPG
jgi:hypothetical protein